MKLPKRKTSKACLVWRWTCSQWRYPHDDIQSKSSGPAEGKKWKKNEILCIIEIGWWKKCITTFWKEKRQLHISNKKLSLTKIIDYQHWMGRMCWNESQVFFIYPCPIQNNTPLDKKCLWKYTWNVKKEQDFCFKFLLENL